MISKRFALGATGLCLLLASAEAEPPPAKGKGPKTPRAGGLAAGLEAPAKGRSASSLGDLLGKDNSKAKGTIKSAAPSPAVLVETRVLGKATAGRRQLQAELGRREAEYARCFTAAQRRRRIARFSARFALEVDGRGKVKTRAQHPKDPLRPKRKLVLRPLLWLCLENALERPLAKGPFSRRTPGRYELALTLATRPKAKKPKKKFIRRVRAPVRAR